MTAENSFGLFAPLYVLTYAVGIYGAYRLVLWWDDRRAARKAAADR